MALALVSVIALAALAAALLVARGRLGLQRQLRSARAGAVRLAEQLAAVTTERDELASKAEWLAATNARVVEDADRHREQADELAVLLDAATADSPTTTPAPGHDAGMWELLLAHVTRRWAAVVGVPPGNREVVDGVAADQLAQALAREVERLREEVGVEVELTVAGPVEPRDPVPFLLAAVELLGVMAACAERVSVDLDGRLALVGEGWVDSAGELGAARDRAIAAGARVGRVEAAADRVRLEVSA